MKKIRVEYLVKYSQIIEWANEDIINLDYDNLHERLEVDAATANVVEYEDIVSIRENGKEIEL